jgi:glycosyltransferase involved in cell wall biosynthesis
MQKKILSVVIPAHDGLGLFVKCLNSVIEQDYSPIEIIVVDDASKIPVKDYLVKNHKELPTQIKITRNISNLGPAKSRNIGLKRARGNYIAFLDSDDIWAKNFATLVINNIEKSNTEINTCIVKPVFIPGFSLGKKIFYNTLTLSRNICFYLMCFLNKGLLDKSFFYMIRLSGMIFKKNAIRNTAFLNDYKYAEDWKFVYDCIYKNGATVGILPKSLVNFTYHKDSETMKDSNNFIYYKKLIKEIPVKHRHTCGIFLFRMYTAFVAWKNNK